jgi:hypothetical protein
MAGDQDFNSMQAQLGLVGQGGSFNPLGIATPAPPPPPTVRHPGDVSQDIVRQTQTQMATTLQTTSAMRLGGMGGMAFGGGNGLGAVGAFAQQYQQNMAGINAQHIAPFSAQMMGMMGGMGGGFNPGMMPHPAMMTTPGMGIYRPFMPPQGPTVSPFPQMPMFQTPLTPMPPPPMFQTPMELSNNMAVQAGQRRTAAMFATPGVAARAGADIGFGYMGAGVGAALGSRFGIAGAAIGGTLGMAAGAFGSEHFGIGATAQHIADRVNPFRTMAIRSQQMQAASQDFVTGGADLNMMTGRGLSRHGATHLGRMLEDTAYSSRFQRQTGGAFSAQDLTKITQVAGQQGMLNDSQSVEQIHDRVKGIAKSLVSFMKIANEPNVVEALKSMGKMRQMGMSIGETMDMAVDARMYSKMAGTSARNLMETAGAQGAMTFQQQGLSAGLGMRMGMGAMGMAGAAVSAGAFSPQRLAMLGGASGVAQREMESTAAFLKQPMMAAAMSTMGRGGEFGMDGRAVRSLAHGGMDVTQMATRGVNNMIDAVGKQGIGAIGMSMVQGTEIQDNLGKLLGPEGAQMSKMRMIRNLQKQMGLENNPGGFATAGLSLFGKGSEDEVKSLMSQANSPEYFNNLRKHLDVQKMELRSLGNDEFERNRPGIGSAISRSMGGFRGIKDTYSNLRNIGEGITDFFGDDEELSQLRERGQVRLTTNRNLIGSPEEIRNMRGLSKRDINLAEANLARYSRKSALGEISSGVTAVSNFVTGGDVEDRMQLHRAEGGVEGLLFGNTAGANVENLYRAGAMALTGTSGGLNTAAENQAGFDDKKRGSDIWARGQVEGVDQRRDRIKALATKTGKSEKEIHDLVAEVASDLGEKAKKAKTFGLKSAEMGGGTAADAVKAKAAAKGITLTDAEADSMAVAATPMAEALAGDAKDAFKPREMMGVAADKKQKELELDAQDSLSEDLFGSHGALGDIGRGTRDRRANLMSKVFGNQANGRIGMLAALIEAGGPEAREAIKAASLEDQAAANRLRESLSDEDRGDLKEMGERQNKTGLSAEEKLAGGEGIRAQELVIKRNRVKSEGRIKQFGEGASLTASTEEMLRNGSREGMSAKMRGLAEKFEKAGMTGADTAEIIEEAEKAEVDSGYAVEKRTGGGLMDKAEAWIAEKRGMIDEAEADVSGSFPQAVDTFNEASHAMLRAANMLNKSSNRTTLPNGNDIGPY